jgi:hypothetical protein
VAALLLYRRFHEKHSTVKDDKKARVQALLKQAKKKAGKKG